MLRSACVAMGMGCLVPGLYAQIPNVLIKFDGFVGFRDGRGVEPKVRAYDLWGRHSLVKIELNVEPGFDFVVSQRFQEIPGDSDRGLLDEVALADPGYWRVGKIYGRFGASRVYRESAYGAEFELTAGSRATPLVVTVINDTDGRQEGAMARLGSKFGVSVATGRHFAIHGSSLTVIRRPEDAPGRNRGYRLLAGIDYSSKNPLADWTFEHVSLRDGETPSDEDLDITHAEAKKRWSEKFAVASGISHEWREGNTFVFVSAGITVYPSVVVEPIVRWRNGEIYDWGIGVRIKP